MKRERQRKSATGVPTLRARDLEGEALALRRSGASFRTIAATLGCGTSTAHGAVTRVLDRIARDLAESAGELRALELERLDALLAAVWPAAVAGDLPAVATALKIAERRARLLGLDAPTRQELSGADGGPLTFVQVMQAFAAERRAA